MQDIWEYLKKILGPALIVLLVYLAWRYGPAIVLALFPKLAPLGPYAQWIAIAVLVVIFLFFILDKGKIGSGPCALKTYWGWPDKCVSVSCTTGCISIKGPWPKAMGTWTPLTQDIACYCPPTGSGIGGWPPDVQKALDKAMLYHDQSKLMRELERIFGDEGIEPGDGDRLLKILEKIVRGEELTPEEQAELKKISKKP